MVSHKSLRLCSLFFFLLLRLFTFDCSILKFANSFFCILQSNVQLSSWFFVFHFLYFSAQECLCSFIIVSFFYIHCFLISFRVMSIFFFRSLSIFNTVILRSLFNKSDIWTSSRIVSIHLFCPYELKFSCLFICLEIFFVENWTFKYYNVITLKIRIFPSSKICCFFFVVVVVFW